MMHDDEKVKALANEVRSMIADDAAEAFWDTFIYGTGVLHTDMNGKTKRVQYEEIKESLSGMVSSFREQQSKNDGEAIKAMAFMQGIQWGDDSEVQRFVEGHISSTVPNTKPKG